jgi:hypothetical protein
MPIRTLEIFRAGMHTSAGGIPLTFSEADLRLTATAYNLNAKSAAPLVLGHPVDDKPAYGKVLSLVHAKKSLYAVADVNPALVDLVKAHRYKKVSASFYTPNNSDNPVKGTYFLRHVGFLGSQPPALKGMEALDFAERKEALDFAESFTELAPAAGFVGIYAALQDIPGMSAGERQALASHLEYRAGRR